MLYLITSSHKGDLLKIYFREKIENCFGLFVLTEYSFYDKLISASGKKHLQ